MFKLTGSIARFDSATNLLVINDNPQTNSMALANGIRYCEEIMPTWKALKSPVVSGSGANFKKNIIEA